MAPPDPAAPTLRESTMQAGGGQPSDDRTIKELDASILPHLQALYAGNANKDGQWHKEQIVNFLHQVQADKVTATSGNIAALDQLDFHAFMKYMTSSDANALAPPVEEDLSWPISSYFISSSHNTYLTGNQLYSNASTDAFKNVLLRGCRCVEIDVWDGDSDGESDAPETADEKYLEKKALRKASQSDRLRDRLPEAITKRFNQTSLGRSLSKRVGRGKDKKKPPTPLEKTASPQESISSLPEDGTPPPTPPRRSATVVEPRVLHGYTLTREVSFRDVCAAIRDDAFTVTDLPLIVSLEVHAGPAQQERMVTIMKETWDGMLLSQPEETTAILPPPESLRNKILVKVKYAPSKTSGEDDLSRMSTTSSASSSTNISATTSGTGAKLQAMESPKKINEKPKKPSKIVQALSELGVYTRGVSFKSLAQAEASMPTHVFSISERSVMEVHAKAAPELFKHNKQFLMRTYPSGMRIASSNLDPPVFWRKGIQIVALNWQKCDEGMMLNEGMFAGTGGYVLKPEGYRGTKPVAVAVPADTDGTGMNPAGVAAAATTTKREGDAEDATTTGATTTTVVEMPPLGDILHHTLDLKVTVYAAQNVPLPKEKDKVASLCPYLKMELHTEPHHALSLQLMEQEKLTGGKAKEEGEYKAKTRSRRGLNPDWKGEVLELRGVRGVTPELAFVRFLIKDDEIGRDDLAAWACVRLDRLRSGWRFVKMMDNRGVACSCAVLLKIEKTLS